MKQGLLQLSCWLLAVAVAVACGCGDAHSTPRQPEAAVPDAAEPQPDAAVGTSQFADYEKSLAHRAPHPTLPGRPLTPEEAEWAAAADFEIGFETGVCVGACPIFKLTFSSNGDLRLTGYLRTWKPGTYLFHRSAIDARTLYQNLILRGFLDLPQSCTDRDDWRDILGPTDAVTKVITLRARGRERKFVNMDPCGGTVPNYETQFALEREILDAAALEPYLTGEWVACMQNVDTQTLTGGFVVHDARNKAIGLLSVEKLDRALAWNATKCDGELVSSGRLSAWDCDVAFISADETTFGWPGMNAELSGVVIRDVYATRSEFPIDLYTLGAEFRQRAERGDVCN